MPDERWLPRRQRSGTGDEYYAPREGIPNSTWPSIRDWLLAVLRSSSLGRLWPRVDVLHTLERRLDLPLTWAADNGESALQSLMAQCASDRELALDVVDSLISLGFAGNVQTELLAEILAEARLVWQIRIGNNTVHLERTVGVELHAIAGAVMQEGGRAGAYLRKAWAELFGRNPKPDSAYRDAIRAVEAASIPIIQPKKADATLGSVLGELRNHPQQFELALRPPPTFDGVGALTGAIGLLWRSQFDRHGTPEDDIDINVSESEAEHAVVLATAMVHCLQNGLLKRRG